MKKPSLACLNQVIAQELAPVDIDADAARILKSATEAVAAILARRAELDREGKYDTPLVVLAGETHSMPAHYIHHMAVLNGLKDRERIAVGLEKDHNLVALGFSEFADRAIRPAEAAWLRQRDCTGKLSIKTIFGFYSTRWSYHTDRTQLRFLLRNKIPVRFTDAASKGNNLDPEDPSTAASMRACFNAIATGMDGTCAAGMQVRNLHMTVLGLDFARRARSRIFIQFCGNAHVAGDLDKHEGKYSLAAQFKNLGIPVLAMPIFYGNFHVPADDGLDAAERLFCAGLPTVRAGTSIEQVKGRILLKEPATEAVYTNAILSRIGMASARLSGSPEQTSPAKSAGASIARREQQGKNDVRCMERAYRACKAATAAAP